MPSATSSPSEPVETTSTSLLAGCSPRRITEPFPNCFSIWLSAAESAFLRLLSSMPVVPPGLVRLFHNRPGLPPENASTTLKLSGIRFFTSASLRRRLAQDATYLKGTLTFRRGRSPSEGERPLRGANRPRACSALRQGARRTRPRRAARPTLQPARTPDFQAVAAGLAGRSSGEAAKISLRA